MASCAVANAHRDIAITTCIAGDFACRFVKKARQISRSQPESVATMANSQQLIVTLMIRIVTGNTAKESTDKTANKNTSSIARRRLARSTVMNIAAFRDIVPLNL